MDFKEFLSLYSANFRRLNESDGLTFWKEFIDGCDEDVMKKAIDSLAAEYQNDKENSFQAYPKLPQIKAAYFEELRDIEAEKYTDVSGQTCMFCEGCGYVWIAETEDPKTGKIRLLNPYRPEPLDFFSIRIVCAPCLCKAGYSCDKVTPRHIRQKFTGHRFQGNAKMTPKSMAECYVLTCDKMYREMHKKIQGDISPENSALAGQMVNNTASTI